jgi:hypothetical protein
VRNPSAFKIPEKVALLGEEGRATCAQKAGQVSPVTVESAHGYVPGETVLLPNIPAVYATLSFLFIAGRC